MERAGRERPSSKAISLGWTCCSAHDVELTGDGGGKVQALARSLRGHNRVARMLMNWVRLVAGSARVVARR
jgi:hypothetical protein